MDKKTLIAIAITAALWIVYFVVFKPEAPVKKPSDITVEKKLPEKKEKQTREIDKQANKKPVKITKTKQGGTESTVTIQTDKYSFVLSNRGAAITNVKYLERDIELSVKENTYNAKGSLDFSIHFDDDEFLNGNSLDDTIWSYNKRGKNSVLFYTDININGNPVRVQKIYTFSKESYDFKVEYSLKNNGNRSIELKNEMLIVSPSDMLGPSLDYTNNYNNLKSIYSLNGDFEQSSKGGGGFESILGCGSSGSKEPIKKETGNINWAGIMSRYFLVIMIPEEFTGRGVILDNRKGTGYRTGMYVKIKSLNPREETKKSFKVYLGEKDKEKLAGVDKTIIDAADVNSLILPIRNFVIWCLLNVNKFIGNMGWSLVIFSLLTKIVFMPLTLKSTESMKKMQQLTPSLNEIKAKHKDKPDVMQKEMMKLYKENKVNPMGGCFPMLLQMPFFFALYSALINSIDLWHAPFILWIQDLSMPDTVLTISGFNLNILPIIMTVTTFLQQRLTTVDTGSSQQQKMMMFMPVIFIFIFWSMPSGLVLYWALQNIFQVLHQVFFVNMRAKKKET